MMNTKMQIESPEDRIHLDCKLHSMVTLGAYRFGSVRPMLKQLIDGFPLIARQEGGRISFETDCDRLEFRLEDFGFRRLSLSAVENVEDFLDKRIQKHKPIIIAFEISQTLEKFKALSRLLDGPQYHYCVLTGSTHRVGKTFYQCTSEILKYFQADFIQSKPDPDFEPFIIEVDSSREQVPRPEPTWYEVWQQSLRKTKMMRIMETSRRQDMIIPGIDRDRIRSLGDNVITFLCSSLRRPGLSDEAAHVKTLQILRRTVEKAAISRYWQLYTLNQVLGSNPRSAALLNLRTNLEFLYSSWQTLRHLMNLYGTYPGISYEYIVSRTFDIELYEKRVYEGLCEEAETLETTSYV